MFMRLTILFFNIFFINTVSFSIEKGSFYLRTRRYKEAIPFLKENFQLGWAYENLGEFEKAISYYKKANPLLKEHALYKIAHCLKALGRYDEAIDSYEKLLDEFPDFVFINTAMKELGWCYEQIGDYENAEDVWDYEFSPPFSLYKIAQLYDETGKNSTPLWLELATKYFNSPYAKEAIYALPEDSLFLIGRIYYWIGEYDSAIIYFDEAGEEGELLALSLYKVGEYEEAREVARAQNLWLIVGKCEEKLDRPKKALLAYSKSNKAEALYLKARLLEELGETKEAISAYCAIPETSSYFEFSNFKAGFLALKEKDLKTAYRVFRHIYPPASYYWRHRIKVLENDEWKADLFRYKLFKEYPLSYYSWLVGGTNGISRINPEKWIKSHSPCSLSSEDWQRFKRGKLLVELGIIDYGAAEFKRLPKRSLLSWKVAKLFHTQGINWLALPYARELNFKGRIPREVAKVLYPLSFFPTIQEVARMYNIDVFLMLALVREESYFNPNAVSVSNAMGLAQIIPPTGREIARQLGVKRYNLFHPTTNLKFGAFYIAQCLKEFNGNVQCALAAYNAGPHRVREWIKEIDTSRMDEWVEWIPFKQTRNYVKKVMRSYYVYKMLYKKDEK